MIQQIDRQFLFQYDYNKSYVVYIIDIYVLVLFVVVMLEILMYYCLVVIYFFVVLIEKEISVYYLFY